MHVVSAEKTEWMVLGKIPWNLNPAVTFHINGIPLKRVNKYSYVGVIFTSTPNRKSFFSSHYQKRAGKGKSVSAATFGVENMVGSLPCRKARWLYQARVDPHLTFGCEIVVDISKAALNNLEDVQKYFLRRMLGVHPRSEVSFLHTETGLLPINARRITLALRYYRYLFTLPLNRIAHAALRECQSMWLLNQDCWLKDECKGIDDMIAGLEAWSWNQVLIDLHNSKKLTILQTRYPKPTSLSHPTDTDFNLQPYLRVPVETLRWSSNEYADIRENQVCRLCKSAVEDEIHAVFDCIGNAELRIRRQRFQQMVVEVKPSFRCVMEGGCKIDILNGCMDDPKLRDVLAMFVHMVLVIYDSSLPYRAPANIPDDGDCPSLDPFVIPEEDDRIEELYA
ncbi:hypothetical protein PQX77_021070 [Marasmius sp. AFHP31]|nr:hypothetical protein PQX77_021070 [Marasmius sp. AFHP31]